MTTAKATGSGDGGLESSSVDVAQYTVGWISALPLERAAATAMLDEIHPKPPRDFKRQSRDPNVYSFGRIGCHNIIVASLPAGVYGLTAASATALHMVSTFPQLQIGLLVGIAAGIPSPSRDIRLGDIVVAQTDGTSPGVIQYDLGKAKVNGQFERKGSLNNPPPLLSHAVAQLQEKHERMDSSVPQYVDEMIRRNPKMATKFSYQGEEHDRLFPDDYEHVSGRALGSGPGPGSGSDCSHCDPSKAITRPCRSSTSNNRPEIHYGTIGSGNTLVKSAEERNAILHHIEEDLICLEMEAAGLINHFPCLVIRGICDYADSHKNDRWQRYAAATAAAYTKELLEAIQEGDTGGDGVHISDVVADELEALKRSPKRSEYSMDNSPRVVFSGPSYAGRDNNRVGVIRSSGGNVRIGGGGS